MARRSASKTTAAPTADTRILVLHGKEDFLKKHHLDTLRDILREVHGDVETFHFDGERATIAEVLDELRSYALMVPYKVVILDKADQFLKADPETKTSPKREAMERYAQNPVDHATLVLRTDAWNRSNLDKLINKVGLFIKCDAPSGAEARKWLAQRAANTHRVKITPGAGDLLVQRIGAQLTALDTELAKLALLAGEKGTIDEALVRQVVGQGSDEQAWAVQEAVLGALDPARKPRPGEPGSAAGRAIVKIHELVDLSGQPDILVSYFVADLVRKLYLAHWMKKQGAGPPQIAKAMKLWGDRQAMFLSVLRRFDGEELATLFDRMIRYDGRSKSGLGKPMRNLECFCAQLAD